MPFAGEKVLYFSCKERTMPRSDKEGWIGWRYCNAKAIIIEDLVKGIIPLSDEECTAKEAWDGWFSHLAEFIEEKVVYSQFEPRFKDHRKQITSKKLRSMHEMDAFRHHRSLHPQQTRDHQGRPIFDVHPAKPLLQEDVHMKRHLEMSPMVLKATRREYGDFDLKTFRQHIYQEVRRQKFIYFLNVKRAEKQKQRSQPVFNPMQPIERHAHKYPGQSVKILVTKAVHFHASELPKLTTWTWHKANGAGKSNLLDDISFVCLVYNRVICNRRKCIF